MRRRPRPRRPRQRRRRGRKQSWRLWKPKRLRPTARAPRLSFPLPRGALLRFCICSLRCFATAGALPWSDLTPTFFSPPRHPTGLAVTQTACLAALPSPPPAVALRPAPAAA
eukprot:scaffold5171_cov126-Isochrysis_galbana.AAC.1